MALDPRNLRPADLARLLNSTQLGTVIDERQLYRHRTRAGFRVGDGKRVDLIRYLGWLIDQRHGPKETKPSQDYEAKKEAARARNAALARSGRDIAPVPEVVDAKRKASARDSFRVFCENYFPLTFSLGWSQDHLLVIEKIEQAVLHGGLFAMAMPRGSGKALALDTPLPTPTGWTTMGEVQVGELLYDERGRTCTVTFVTEVQIGRPCYQVTFDDGEAITCDADHLWTVRDRYDRRGFITLNTESMASRYVLPDSRGRNAHRYSIPLMQPLQAPARRLPIDPYVLGAWLGDGNTDGAGFTCHAKECDEFTSHMSAGGEALKVYDKQPEGLGRRCRLLAGPAQKTSLQTRLRMLGVIGNKHIPQAYLRADVDSRRALLQGLMDTDGHVSQKNGSCEITLKPEQLANDLRELLSSLGIKHHRSLKTVQLDGQDYGPYHQIRFHATRLTAPFRLRYKQSRLRLPPKTRPISESRTIIGIERVASVPVRCIQVDSPSRLYAAGRGMIPTHNTTLAECACLWAMLYGHRDFVCLIGSDEGHAQAMLESIKTELEANDLLADDFPEVCHPIRSLEGIANRCSGQLFNGKRTQIGWTASEIVLPTLEGSDASGAIIRVAGITGRIRGMKFKRPDGHTVRPSLVILDDPQTDESARSLSQCANRERIIAGAVLGLAGPGKKISGIMPCTVIRPGDMADSVLDRDKHPEWNGERTRMVLTFPTSEKLWDQYANIRADCLRAKGTIEDATAFYIKHRDRMDAGASVAWPDRYNHDEASAIQHAMNLKLQDEAAFWAEYQNEPLPEDLGAEEQLTVDDIASKLNGLPRRRVPLGVDHLTAFVDVQGKLLYWVVCGWREDFSGFVIDYGTEPDQRRRSFTLRDASPTLQSVAPGVGLEGTILQGLNRLADRLLEKPWQREDGAELRIDRFLIDANWGTSTDVVYQFCRSHKQAALLLPSHGRYVGASSIPFSDYKRKRGDRLGLNWRMPSVAGKRAIRHLVFDANYWKSFIHARLAVPLGDRSGLSLFGRDPHQHRLLAEHCTAEYRVKTEGRGRTVDEWKLRPEASDNHWWDGLVGCAVAASMLGINLPENQPAIPAREHRRIKLSDIRR